MKFEKYTKQIGTIFSFIAAVLIFIKWFAPNQVENKNLDFMIAVLKNSIFELATILIIGLVFYFYSKIKNLFLRKKSIIIKNRSVVVKTTLILLFCVGININNVIKIFRSRYFHYTHIQNAHKFQLYKNISNSLKAGQFNTAVNKIEEVITFYPDEKYVLNRLKTQLKGRADYSQNFYKLDEKTILSQSDENPSLDKNKLIQLIISYSLFTHPRYKSHITASLNLIENEISILQNNFQILKTQPLSNQAKDYLVKHKWFFIDSNLEKILTRKKIDHHDFIIKMVKNHSFQSLADLQNKVWFHSLLSSYVE